MPWVVSYAVLRSLYFLLSRFRHSVPHCFISTHHHTDDYLEHSTIIDDSTSIHYQAHNQVDSRPSTTPLVYQHISTSPIDFQADRATANTISAVTTTALSQQTYTMPGRPSRPRPPKPPQPRDGDSRYAYMSMPYADSTSDYDPVFSLCRGGGSGGGKGGNDGPQPRDDGKSRWSRSCAGGGDGNGQDPKGPWPRDPGSRRGRMCYDPQPRDPGW